MKIKRYIKSRAKGLRLFIMNKKNIKIFRRPRLQEVNCEWSAFNEGDVFILEFKNWLVQWNGKSANRFEKLKACQCLAEMAAR